eukprot:5493277-Lingulodinium_polyedra.AAC.1
MPLLLAAGRALFRLRASPVLSLFGRSRRSLRAVASPPRASPRAFSCASLPSRLHPVAPPLLAALA